jgi:hypothetical protein
LIGAAPPQLMYPAQALWGRPVSTWVVNLEVRTELQCRS